MYWKPPLVGLTSTSCLCIFFLWSRYIFFLWLRYCNKRQVIEWITDRVCVFVCVWVCVCLSQMKAKWFVSSTCLNQRVCAAASDCCRKGARLSDSRGKIVFQPSLVEVHTSTHLLWRKPINHDVIQGLLQALQASSPWFLTSPSGSVSLINVGSGFHCLGSFFLFLFIAGLLGLKLANVSQWLCRWKGGCVWCGLYKQQNIKTPQHLRDIIQTMYTGCLYLLIDGDKVSEEVAPNKDLKQGCPLSPFLYSLYTNGIDRFLTVQRGAATALNSVQAPNCDYADDIALTSNTAECLQF